MALRIGINGFGRIGRCFVLAARGAKDIEVNAINDITDSPTLAHLLKYDSIHGRYPGDVQATEKGLKIDGREIPVTAILDPAKLSWKERNVDIVLESTGIFVDRASASKHLEAGAKKVVISAPAKEPDATIAVGINDQVYDASKHHIISNASCTTNCLAPVAKVIHETFGIEHGLMTTIHSYTNDQRILDQPHKDLRRARAAAISMIPTTTGAAKAIGLVLPALKGKLDGMAIRTPTFNVSLVDLVVEVKREATIDSVNEAIRKAAEGPLEGILEYCEEPLVSIDFNGSTMSSVFDAPSTRVIGGRLVKVLAWYDNEIGYAHRIVDLARIIGKSL